MHYFARDLEFVGVAIQKWAWFETLMDYFHFINIFLINILTLMSTMSPFGYKDSYIEHP